MAQIVKNLPLMQESWVGKIPLRRVWLPTSVFLPVEFHGQRSLVGVIMVHGVIKSWTQLSDFTHSPGCIFSLSLFRLYAEYIV